MIWHSPRGQTYTTHPGSRILFPTLCRPTAPVDHFQMPPAGPNRGLMMPRRKRTRAHNRATRINTERNQPPPG